MILFYITRHYIIDYMYFDEDISNKLIVIYSHVGSTNYMVELVQ